MPAIGYDRSAELAKQALNERRPLREVVKEAGILPDSDVDRILDTRRMTRGGVL